MSIVDTSTGEVLDVMSAGEARLILAKVRAGVDGLREDIVRLHSGRAWVALGIESWDVLCDQEFGVRLALPKPERIALVTDLREQGMSTRAIGSALGVTHPTVLNDIKSGGKDLPPARVTGLDGKPYAPTAPPRPPAPVLTVEERENLAAIDRAVNRLGNFLDGFDTAANLHHSPLRDEVLAALDPFDAERFQRIEKETSWPSTRI